VRTLNYLTGAGGPVDLEYPADLYEVVGSLKVAAARLPQLFGQMAAWLESQHTAGQVAHDSGSDASEYVTAVADALQRASQDAAPSARPLTQRRKRAAASKPISDGPHATPGPA
jgi:hypothetical protein